MNILVACTAASHLILTKNPSYFGLRMSDNSTATALQANFETRQRKLHPMAIGRMPPSFFDNTIKKWYKCSISGEHIFFGFGIVFDGR